jgi:hypothetical protein
MSDPTFNCTPGKEISNSYFKTCRCGESILMGQTQDVLTRQISWHTWDATPIEKGPHRYYRRHKCEARR